MRKLFLIPVIFFILSCEKDKNEEKKSEIISELYKMDFILRAGDMIDDSLSIL
jgi:hypothetical protein